MKPVRLPVASVALALMLAASEPAPAQSFVPPLDDLVRELDVMPDDIERRVTEDRAVAATAVAPIALRGVIWETMRWRAGDAVTVCFWGGSTALRRRIRETASAWNDVGANIHLDFGDANEPRLCQRNSGADIRVGFDYPGYWSYVGRESITQAGINETTLNLARFNRAPPRDSPEFNRIVLHEFGHALGFMHEHQHRDGGCEREFKWQLVKAMLANPPYSWPPERIDANLNILSDYFGMSFSEVFDAHSIMLYAFPVEFYENGANSRCYTAGNFTISDGDRQALHAAYPSSGGRGPEPAALVNALNSIATLPQDTQTAVSERIALSLLDTETLRMLSRSVGEQRIAAIGLSDRGVRLDATRSEWRALLEGGYFARVEGALIAQRPQDLESALARAAQ